MHIRNHGNHSRILVRCLVNFPTQYNQMHKQHSSILVLCLGKFTTQYHQMHKQHSIILVLCLGNFPTQHNQIHEQHTFNFLIANGFYFIWKHYSYSRSWPRKTCENLSAFSGKFSGLIKPQTAATIKRIWIVFPNNIETVCN